MSSFLFLDTSVDDVPHDVRWKDGTITALRPRGAGAPLTPLAGEEVRRGGCLTPPMAEPHTHLDAALLGQQAPNRSGTLVEGIANWSRLRDGLTAEDVTSRARRTAEMYAGYGTLRIRTHVDTGNLVAVEALIQLRRELAEDGIELQVVAFPQEGILRAPGREDGWRQAVAMGCDAVGAIPHFERTTEEGWRSVRMAFELAERHGIAVDLHCDETDDPESRHLEVVCAETLDRGMAGKVVAGHCTSMHSQPNPYAAKIVELVAQAGVQVVTNPLDNIVLQGRFDTYPRRRGHTRVDELWAAGAEVGIGHDSVMDPWYRLGTANMLDPAYMLVHYAHLTSEAHMRRTFRTLHDANHLPFGGRPTWTEGGRAQLLWWPSADPIEIVRVRPQPLVLR